MAAKPRTIDEFLATLSKDQRAALQRLRRIIRAAAPKAEERISYGVPAFYQDGLLVAFGATPNHCSFYPGTALAAFGDELRGYDTSKGTIRFQADKPLAAALVRKLVKVRLAMNAMKAERRFARRKPGRTTRRRE